ncbi:MAG TPA: trypsin-like peptidase domain-containing protein [Streptosporangiaceae bacterium]|nr:trypsin-like peptidase domain-containing protein [Streptosporangiaceae bacterium]
MSNQYGSQDRDGGQAPTGAQGAGGPQFPYGAQPGYGAIPPPPPPPPPWAGYGAWTGGAGQHAAPRRRPHRALIMAAGVAAVALAAGGTAWAAEGSHSAALSTSTIASQTDPGLVDITSTLAYQQATAEGTGMVLTSTGEILTNNHVIAGATSVKVRDIGNGRTYVARVVGYSDSDDVAVLQLVGASRLATVSVGNSGSVAAGQAIVALGNAEGKGGTPAVATGHITGTGDSIIAEDDGDGAQEHLTGMIRTDANIEPGDSGGPLVSSTGQVIGMDTAASTSSSTGYGTTSAETTTAFSIPISRAIAIAQQIESGRSSATVHIGATAFLGVEVTSSQQSGGAFGQGSSGVQIAGVVRGTAADSAGLGEGDTIISVAGHQISSDSDLQKVIEQYHPGDKVSVEWANQFGQTRTATVTLTAGPVG